MSAPAANDVVSFKDRATADQARPHNYLLKIEQTIQDIDVARVLVDTGCSANIIYKSTLKRMEIVLCAVKERPSPIFGLSENATMTLGSIDLVVKAGRVTKVTEFLVIDRPTSYNTIVGTPWLNSMRAIPSTFHLCLKFLPPRGVETIQGDRRMSQVCFAAELERKNLAIKTSHKKKTKLTLDENAPERDSEVFGQSQRAEALEGKRKPTCEPVILICLDESSPERCVEIGANLRGPLKTELIACHKKNLNAFAWAAEDMPGIDIGITCHELNIDPTYRPVKQKRRKLGQERATAVNEEVERLLKIMMNPDNREKTAFITDRGTYCYKVMPFGLKNAGATYQRLVNRIFSEQLGKTMEVYINDMLVKSLDELEHVSHLEECFAKLNAHNMKLNPATCRFAVASGEFLGYLVTCRGMEANPRDRSQS
ncbi:PREDICTED: uncharacterized protein LOC106338686 [Brassica oleracea var. oleracea]|uniref:uncharacterized protein LOC106338686 n=1 Tax=Brassica oleracea var. oleracea TaxID=109376 RepID=UPI0006A751F8|nr:PREDICTED: uncharacterized protein LOC106338686 [Brassica oleracea var. oleracea]